METSVRLYWLEPEESSWAVTVPLSTEDTEKLRDEVREVAGPEWGVSIPSIRILPEVSTPWARSLSLEDFASAMMYDEDNYFVEISVFKDHGIKRQR